MPSLKDLKLQIKSVKSTKKITTAMKMVAASKLRRAQDKAESARPYSLRLEEMLFSLATTNISGEGVTKLLTGTGKQDTYLVVAVTADRGLCGGFNSNINRATIKYVRSLEDQGKKVNIITIGKKSRDFLVRLMKDRILESFTDLGASGAGYDLALQVSEKIQSLYYNDQFDVCVLIYNKFKSAIAQKVTQQQLIPLNLITDKSANNLPKNSDNAIYTYEPDENEILKDLLPKNVSIQIFKTLLESNAGEQAARMIAMDNATRNAGEMVDSLTLKFNRTRQANITRELIEIISGAESV